MQANAKNIDKNAYILQISSVPLDGQQKLMGLFTVQSSLSQMQSYASAPIASQVASEILLLVQREFE